MTEGETRRQEAEIGRSMRRVSRGLSAFALTLMIVGLVLALTTAPRPLDPRALDLSARGQRLMLGGVVVLCLLPAVRVLTAGAHYAAGGGGCEGRLPAGAVAGVPAVAAGAGLVA
ncbi:MAG: hypothetical protein P8Y02_10220 [Deinococcales bacterium]